MAKKATITPVTDTVNNASAINTQLNAINNQLDNTLSLDGSTPNAMNADLDMNSNDILNVGDIQASSLTVAGFDVASALAAGYSVYVPPGTGAVTRGLAVKLGDVVSASDYGTLQQALTHLNSNGGGTLWIPPGDITVTSSVTLSVAADIEIVFAAGARVVAGAGLATPVFNFSDSVLQTHNVRFVSPKIDCSAGNSPIIGNQYCSAIAVTNLKSLVVLDAFLYGGTSPTNVNADSGVTTVNCTKVLVRGGRIEGFNDAGVYPGGDNTDGDGCFTTVENVYFYRCASACTAKRDMDYMRFAYNEVVECISGIQSNEISSPFALPPKRMDVIGNLFKKVQANVVRYSATTKGRMANNTIEDWGFSIDGVTNFGSSGIATFIRGAREIDHENNTYRFREWTPTGQRAILHDNVTLNAVVYTYGYMRSKDNTYIGVPTVYAATALGDPSVYVNEVFQNCTTIKTAVFNSDSLISYTVEDNPRSYAVVGGTVHGVGAQIQTESAVDLTLTAEDTGGLFIQGTATGTVIWTLPPAVEGLEYTFTIVANQTIRIQTAAGDQIRMTTGSSTAGGYVESATRWATITIKANGVTNWITKAITGTWTVA
jgi:hypothetical protein